jgi:hypothetical protein
MRAWEKRSRSARAATTHENMTGEAGARFASIARVA